MYVAPVLELFCEAFICARRVIFETSNDLLSHMRKYMRKRFQKLILYEAYSESKYRFAVKKSSKVSYKILLLSDSTFFKLFFHIFAAITEALIEAGHRFFIPSS